MGAGDADKHNLFAGPHFADAMDNRNASQRPAASRLFDNGRQRFFGHSRIVLQRQRFYAVAEIMITHFPGKRAMSVLTWARNMTGWPGATKTARS